MVLSVLLLPQAGPKQNQLINQQQYVKKIPVGSGLENLVNTRLVYFPLCLQLFLVH